MRISKLKPIIFLSLGLAAGCGYSVPSYQAARMRGQTTYAKASSAASVAVQSERKADIVVKRGDTVYSLARRHDVPIRALIQMNGLKAPFTLSVGQKLTLPSVGTHTVAKGDTVYSISRRYGVDMSALARLNNIRYPYAIAVGQVLTLPGAVVRPSYEVAAASRGTQTDSKPAAKKKEQKKETVKLPAPPSRSSGRFAWPLKGKVTAEFGAAGEGRHNDGINIRVPAGTPVKASENGIVAYAGNELKGFGNLLLLKHADGWVTAYAHNSALLVRRGQTVARGEVIAKAGNTGSASEPQLHFEIRKGTKAVNPRDYLSFNQL